MRRARVVLRAAPLLLLAAWSGRGCRPRESPQPDITCEAVAGPLAERVDAEALIGDYTLVLAATSGPRANGTVAGRLRLTEPPPSAPATAALYGTADIDIARVGAVASGALDSTDPAAPGVIALSWSRRSGTVTEPQFTLRLGADANRPGPISIEGTYLALHVHAASSTRMDGAWTSGAGDEVARGHFCAVRRP